VYTLCESEQLDFQKVMRRGVMHPGITALKMALSGEDLPSFTAFEPFTEPEESFDADVPSAFDNMTPVEQRVYRMVANYVLKEDQGQNGDRRNHPLRNDGEEDDSDNDSITSDSDVGELGTPLEIGGNFVTNSLMREEIRPFYRFELFPNLKKLSISQADHLYALDSFVIDGFAALKKLEYLKLDIRSRSIGSHYLFKGFLKLPFLKKFSLHINFMKNNDWVLLQQFVKDQKNLESFGLTITNQPGTRPRYLQQNAYLEGLIKCLEGKHLLKSLEFRSGYWSLEAISKGLAHLNMVNQLQTLKFEGSDDTVTSDQKPWKRVEGLCNFIKNQKESLEKLWVFLPFVLEDNPVTHIAEAISKLTQLKELQFSVNSCFLRGLGHFVQYFENTLQYSTAEKSKKSIKVSKTWNPSLGKYLKKLENLEEFILRFDIVHKKSPTWFVDVMTALPSLEKLRHVRVTTNSGRLLYKGEEKTIAAVLQLKNVRRFTFVSFDNMNGFFPSLMRLKRIAGQFTEKQSMRCDLMF